MDYDPDNMLMVLLSKVLKYGTLDNAADMIDACSVGGLDKKAVPAIRLLAQKGVFPELLNFVHEILPIIQLGD
jgi:hypothetical protein